MQKQFYRQLALALLAFSWVSPAVNCSALSADCAALDPSCDPAALLGYALQTKARFLYFSDSAGGSIRVARILDGGLLAAPTIAASLAGVTELAVNSEGTILVAGATSGLTAYRINTADGSILPGFTDSQIGAPAGVAFDPRNRFVVAVSPTGSEMVCRVVASATLSGCVKRAANNSVAQVVVHPTLDIVYGVNNGAPATFLSYTVDPSSLVLTLQPATATPPAGTTASALAIVTRGGTQLYGSFAGANPNGPIVTVSIDAAGGIGSSVSTAIVNGFGGLIVDPAAGALVVGTQTSNSLLAGYARSSDGSLAASPTVLLNIGPAAPTRIAADPSGRTLYVVDSTGAQIVVLRVSESTIAQVGTAPGATSGNGLALAVHTVGLF